MSTAIAPHRSNLPAIFECGETEEQIRPFLPEGVSYARVVAAAQLAALKTPALHQCTAESVIMSVARILQWGLEIGTTAYLVPFGKECTPIAAYTGLAELMIESGSVRHVDARCVYSNEFFEQLQGSEARITHKPISDVKDRGELIGAYCILRLPFNQSVFEFYPLGEIDAVRRQHSKQWKGGACPAWWAKKYAVRQISKLMPKGRKSHRVFDVIEQDASEEFGAIAPAVDEDEVIAPAVAPREIESSSHGVRLEEPTMSLVDALAFIIPRGKMKGERLDSLTPVQMRAALLWTVDNDAEPDFQLAVATVLMAENELASDAKDAAPVSGAPQDEPTGKPSDLESPAPSAALPLEPGQTYPGDPYPENLAHLGPSELKAKAMQLLTSACLSDAFVKGSKEMVNGGLSKSQLRNTIRQIEEMIAAAPPKRQPGERRSHSAGVLPGGA